MEKFEMSHIFISYAHEDREVAERMFRDLRNLGYSVWIDSENLLAGERWKVAIRAAIRDSTLFLALFSNRSLNKRGFVQREIHQALEILEEFPQGASYVIPVRIEDTQPRDERLLDLQWVDLFPSYSRGFERLLKAIPEELRTTAVTRSRVEKSDSERAKLLREFLALTVRIGTNTKLLEAMDNQDNQVATQLARPIVRSIEEDHREIHRFIQQIDLLCSEPVLKAASQIASYTLGLQLAMNLPDQRETLLSQAGDLITELIPRFKLAVRQELGVRP